MKREIREKIIIIIAIIGVIVMLGFAWGTAPPKPEPPITRQIQSIEYRRSVDPHCKDTEPVYMTECNRMYDNFIQEIIDKENAKHQ